MPLGKGGALCAESGHVVRPLKMAALLLSVHPLIDQCLLPLHPNPTPQLTFLSTCPRPQLVIVLIKEVGRGVPLCWFPW